MRLRVTAARYRILLVAALAAVGLVTGWAATAGAVGSASAEAAGLRTARLIKGTQDWEHVQRVVAYLKAKPPTKPLIIMFGTSTVRESTVSDRSWEKLLRRKAGVAVNAYNLGSTNQTFRQNRRLVEQLPAVPTIVLIGVDVVRFTATPAGVPVALPSAFSSRPSYAQHRYSKKRILSAAKKRALVRDWVRRRYKVFKRNYAKNLAELKKLISECLDKGMYPVLLESPRNTAAIKSAFNKATRRYRADCLRLEAQYGGQVRYFNLLNAAKFRNADFYDIWHAVEPGRARWQPRLSALAAKMLKKYGMAATTR